MVDIALSITITDLSTMEGVHMKHWLKEAQASMW